MGKVKTHKKEQRLLLDFFTDPYKDELIYSAIARYHFYSGNVDYRDTIEECFGKRTMIPTLQIGGNFDYLSKALGKRYSSEIVIFKHTILPYYSPFIDEKVRQKIIEEIKYEGSNSIYTKLGIVAGGVCRKDSIFYCPRCAGEDIDKYGEPYIHREHQLEGIILCPQHGIILEKYPLKKIDVSRIEYIRLEKQYLNLTDKNIKLADYDKHFRLAKTAYYLLDKDLNNVSKEKVFKRYRYFLYQKGLLKGNKTIDQRNLYEKFICCYGKEFLKQLDSEIDYGNEYNWLKVISRKSKRFSHPLRHLLFINFLCEDIEEFFHNIDECKFNEIKKINEAYFIENTDLEKLKAYKAVILKAINDNKDFSRTAIHNKYKKEYMYLYRYDKKWLFNNLPTKVKVNQDNHRIDWNERDKQYLELLKEKHEVLLEREPVIRITKGNLAKSLGILVNIEKRLEQLPLTKKFFEEVCESTEAFQIRRAKAVIDKIDSDIKNMKLWNVQRLAGIRSEQFKKIKSKIQKYLKEKQGE
ncbi:TnsD family Tn7-like transposition protein [Clostridium butyricum]|uniref:TnsD family Tn7-like transposition protein n=1 Tax=Clostridium butyricum TaxID=1492 RepID=UPI001F611C0C|nr:TnsD family Tn7-like transposition protein [Clostridium butyricum]